MSLFWNFENVVSKAWDANAAASDRFCLWALFLIVMVSEIKREKNIVGRVEAQRLFASLLPKIRNRNTPPTTFFWVINVPGYLSNTSRCFLQWFVQNGSVFVRINQPVNKDNSVISVFQQPLFTTNMRMKAALWYLQWCTSLDPV